MRFLLVFAFEASRDTVLPVDERRGFTLLRRLYGNGAAFHGGSHPSQTLARNAPASAPTIGGIGRSFGQRLSASLQ